MVPLLLIIALLSVTGTFVESASNKTVCDEERSNDQCNQYGCVQQPCSILCGQSSPYDRCTQQCNSSTCNSMVCTSSVNSCLQECPIGGICKSFGCDANDCNQKCKGGDCGVMMCASSSSSSNCEQTDGSVMICHSKSCRQVCGIEKKCNMTCSSDVQHRCIQRCLGECFYQCDIQPVEKCQLECISGNCTKIESPTSPKPTSKATDKGTSPKPTTSKATDKGTSPKPTTSKATDKGIGARQLGVLVSVAFGLMFAFVAFV